MKEMMNEWKAYWADIFSENHVHAIINSFCVTMERKIFWEPSKWIK